MANNRTVTAAQLKEGSIILVKGKLAFSRLARLIDGQALTEKIARERQQGRLYPTEKPHTTVTLVDAQVMFTNPNAPTPEETFLQESLYTSKTGENAGKIGYGIDNIGNSLPPVLEIQETGSYKQVVLENDLATGLDVTLVLNVFKSPTRENRGIGLAQVLVNQPIEYYAGGGVTAATLQARGIVIEGGIQAVAANQAPADASAEAAAPAGSVMVNGLPMPGPAAPQATAPAAVAPAPVQQVVETDAQKSARLEAELAALRASTAAPAGSSPFDAVPVPAGGSPWDAPQGITYQG